MRKSSILKITVVLILAARYCCAQSNNPVFPDDVSLQYAGSNGWVSVGAGYNLFNDHFRVGMQYGFVPKHKGGDLHILSAALVYRPLRLKLSDNVSINPIDFGVKASYQFGENYYLKWPSKYPDGYYWWNSAIRLHLITESSLTVKLSKSPFKSITGFVELNTNDLYMVSYVLNLKSLKPTEIIKTGVGVRLQF
ncbi:hypothetical protein [Dyadobacter psychrotolerans]|uniref:Outer membrane protein beta-barrel domain-containing protein n=1 Tax=Dyadobacter psychrotolerans TaxID=2541721 RepID=A0A4R5DRX7_9BACT|nr:hypothetical protein [Dyadobacter psychrotolerans]TDE14811.1 hypothetical protein E0F88_16645 [Dyadobacter psychrotolerans]